MGTSKTPAAAPPEATKSTGPAPPSAASQPRGNAAEQASMRAQQASSAITTATVLQGAVDANQAMDSMKAGSSAMSGGLSVASGVVSGLTHECASSGDLACGVEKTAVGATDAGFGLAGGLLAVGDAATGGNLAGTVRAGGQALAVMGGSVDDKARVSEQLRSGSQGPLANAVATVGHHAAESVAMAAGGVEPSPTEGMGGRFMGPAAFHAVGGRDVPAGTPSSGAGAAARHAQARTQSAADPARAARSRDESQRKWIARAENAPGARMLEPDALRARAENLARRAGDGCFD